MLLKMSWLSGVQDFLYFVQAWQVATRLRVLLDCMDVPDYRKRIDEIHNLQWLDRNIGINNSFHKDYGEVRWLLALLFDDSRYRALKWEMWRAPIEEG